MPLERRDAGVTVDEPTEEEIERTAGRAWFVGGLFVGFGGSPIAGLVVYVIARFFFDHWTSILFVFAAAVLSFGLGLAYVALARTLEG